MSNKKTTSPAPAPASKVAVINQPAGLPVALMGNMAALAGAGQAQHTEDFAIPFLVILQAQSPQVVRGEKDYIPAAESSMIMNTVTKELYDGEKGICVVPVAFEKVYIEWKPRESGGGMVRIHDRASGTELESKATRNDKNQAVLANGNILAATAQHYVLILREDGTMDKAVIAMSSTQLKKSRNWNTRMSKVTLQHEGKTFPAPSFAAKYRLTTKLEDNQHGSWFGWEIENDGSPDAPAFLQDSEAQVFEQAKAFYESFSAGAIQTAAQRPEAAETVGAPSSTKTGKVM